MVGLREGDRLTSDEFLRRWEAMPDLKHAELIDGGQSGEAGPYGSGAPELIVEVAASSRSRDLGSKLRLYERAGVREYITALVRERRVSWRELVDGRYREIAADEDGLLRSRVFPGLWLDPGALWPRDLAGLLAAVDRGVKSAEHGVFVRLLESRRR